MLLESRFGGSRQQIRWQSARGESEARRLQADQVLVWPSARFGAEVGRVEVRRCSVVRPTACGTDAQAMTCRWFVSGPDASRDSLRCVERTLGAAWGVGGRTSDGLWTVSAVPYVSLSLEWAGVRALLSRCSTVYSRPAQAEGEGSRG